MLPLASVRPAASRLGLLIAALVALAGVGAAPASAFDSGPHGDMTIDAMQAEGFGLNAAKVAQLSNYFVDFYAQSKNDPYSSHSSVKVLLAAQPIDVTELENWPRNVREAANISHFDATDRPGAFSDTTAVAAEWSRLRRATYKLLQTAKSHQNEVEVLEAIGMSLHELQDFYAHSNWVDAPGLIVGGPGWNPIVEGDTPTWFDVPDGRRGDVYSSGGTGKRTHGSWQQDNNKTLLTGINKDWPGRPRYAEAFMTSYFATRQWVAAAAVWLNDPALWAKARAYSKKVAELNEDINDGDIAVSRNTGRWYGEGGPCQPDVSWDSGPSCGSGEGLGGTLLGARSAIKDYHGDHSPTTYRKTFERLVPGLVADPQDVTEAMVPVQSSRPIRKTMQFVRLKVTSMAGIELEDPIPTDGADLYAKATIAGQDYLSAVIDDRDSFSFPSPYAPYTFIKAVPINANYATPISNITVKIHTTDRRWASTNDDVYVEFAPGLRFPLDKSLYDDFERNDTDTYSVPIDQAARASLNRGHLQYVRILKSSDGAGGGWSLDGVKVVVDGTTIADQQGINTWLEDNHRTWTTSIARDHRAGPALPVWLNLYDEDGFIYGDDDTGDVNPYDNRDAVVRAYTPGTVLTGTSTGGYQLGGRIGKGGDTARVSYAIDTIIPKMGTGSPFVMPESTQVVQSADPPPPSTPPTTPPTTPTTPPTTPAQPDLVITSLTHFKFTVKNQGTTAAGPFSVTVTNFPPVSNPKGLAPGQSATFTYGDKCMVTNHAVVDSLFEVAESDETNNALDYNSGC